MASEMTCPYFINLDIDPYRSCCFLYELRREETLVGSLGDMVIFPSNIDNGIGIDIGDMITHSLKIDIDIDMAPTALL